MFLLATLAVIFLEQRKNKWPLAIHAYFFSSLYFMTKGWIDGQLEISYSLGINAFFVRAFHMGFLESLAFTAPKVSSWFLRLGSMGLTAFGLSTVLSLFFYIQESKNVKG